jgi:hypothetical protein
LLAADSFRVRANPRTGKAEVRGLDLHLRRFTRAVLDAHGLAGEDPGARRIIHRVDAFLADALPRIAAYGEGFPRLELREPAEPGDAPEPGLALRPLPELRDTIELRSAPGVRLEHPQRKGPNIARLAELNRELGAEALLLDGDGGVLEGATTSLLWWPGDPEDRKASGAVVRSSARVPSVTECLVVDAANRLPGTQYRIGQPQQQPRGITVEQLLPRAGRAPREVWALNALHGIRVVTSIDGVALPEPDTQRLACFREALDQTWQPIKK